MYHILRSFHNKKKRKQRGEAAHLWDSVENRRKAVLNRVRKVLWYSAHLCEPRQSRCSDERQEGLRGRAETRQIIRQLGARPL